MSISDDASQAAIVLDDVTLRYRGTPAPAVEELSLTVPVGAGAVIYGERGSGTTAVIKCIVGQLSPFSGEVRVFGHPPQHPTLRPRVGYCPERTPFLPHSRVVEVVRVIAGIRGVVMSAAADALDAAGLARDDRRTIRSLEIEDSRRLALACALVGDPELLVLDDPWEFPETVDALAAAKARGATIVVATPDPGGFPDLVGPMITLPGGGEEEGLEL